MITGHTKRKALVAFGGDDYAWCTVTAIHARTVRVKRLATDEIAEVSYANAAPQAAVLRNQARESSVTILPYQWVGMASGIWSPDTQVINVTVIEYEDVMRAEMEADQAAEIARLDLLEGART